MHRVDGDGNVSGSFIEGVPGLQEATVITGAWLNAVQEEMANVVEGTGATLNKADNTQLWTRLKAWFGRLASPNTWSANNFFTSSPVNADSSDAGAFLSSTVAPATNKRWCVFSLAIGGGVYARLYASWAGGIRLVTNASWNNTTQLWTCDVANTASYSAMMSATNGLLVTTYTASSTTGFTTTTFDTTAVTLGAGSVTTTAGVTVGGALGVTGLTTAAVIRATASNEAVRLVAPATGGNTYLTFFGDGNSGPRTALVGTLTGDPTSLTLQNDTANGNVNIYTNGTGTLKWNGGYLRSASVTPTLGTGYSTGPSGVPPTCQKACTGLVSLYGSLAVSTGATSAVTTFPSAVWPAVPMRFYCGKSNGSGSGIILVSLSTTGALTATAPTVGDVIELSGLSYMAA